MCRSVYELLRLFKTFRMWDKNPYMITHYELGHTMVWWFGLKRFRPQEALFYNWAGHLPHFFCDGVLALNRNESQEKKEE